MLKIRRPLGRLIFNMGIAIPGKTVFLIETAPWVRQSLRMHSTMDWFVVRPLFTRMWFEHIEAEAIRQTYSRQHFQIHFCEWKCIYLGSDFTEIVHKGPINNIASLVHIMAWRRPGDKPLSEPMMIILFTHISVTRPQIVKLKQCTCWLTFVVTYLTE